MGQDILSVLPDPLNYIIRIFYAALCGFIIGFERKARSKEAGIRTHSIVCMGASLIMIVSKYSFWDMNNGFDAARVAAQVVSGIGFLGAGMIVYSRGALHGLTTAAGIWATAGVGLCIGAGGNTLMIVGGVATLFIVGIHLLLHLPLKIFSTKTHHQIQVQFKVYDGAIDRLKEIFGVQSIFRMRMQTVNGERIGTALLRTIIIPEDNSWQKIMEENEFITAMEYFEEEWH